ncbi:molybdopterin oxidoreductase family protein [Leeia sp. TBRC 13508]|uniref:Molybdopterin oxidoreductase family protein n=1 Tax=Leeia speluncae TaxID=2884804 RepID=A0ABS8DAZ8_9NEIS|nr:molybdopterin oxidoreductase family protein [Leeia speluncae]MCB6185393.1 molybdopterin oxidoreductase family protein [Leeia speluncae]
MRFFFWYYRYIPLRIEFRMKTLVKGACPHDCPDTCAMQITVENDRVIKVNGAPDHEPTKGALCTKVAKYTERLYHAERVLHPLKRVGQKGEGKFEQISWGEALDTIAGKLTEIAKRSPESILPYNYAGTMGLVQADSMSARLFHRLGASLLGKTICASAGSTALKHTYGAGVGMQMQFFNESKLIVLWGTNSITSNLHLWSRIQDAKRLGAKVVAIDPYRSLTAEKCDAHIALLPGTDGAFALGVMNLLIQNNWLDHDYITQFSVGFDELKERAKRYSPEVVADICGIEAAELEWFAKLYGETAVIEKAPVAIRLNYGMQRSHGGGQAVRAVACLPTLVGAWRNRAGGLLLSSSGFFPVNMASLQRPDLLPDPAHPPRTINMSTIGDALCHLGDEAFGPKVEAVVVYNSNPVAVAPDSVKVAKGFAREDLFTVVLEHFLTDTCDYADIVLPATMQMEHLDIHKSYGHTWYVVNEKAVSAPGECLSNTEIFRQLAKKMGLADACFTEDDETLLAQAIDVDHPALLGISREQLRETGWFQLNLPDAPFAEGRFYTTDGKCHFYSVALEKEGLDPLPDFVAPIESKKSNPSLAEKYPLAMISPPARNFMNTTFANIQTLMPKPAVPTIEIHPDDAILRGIKDGQQVKALNDRGELLLTAIVTPKVRKGVVVIPSIWWKKKAPDGKNANELTSQALTDLGQAPTFYDCLVEVLPA